MPSIWDGCDVEVPPDEIARCMASEVEMERLHEEGKRLLTIDDFRDIEFEVVKAINVLEDVRKTLRSEIERKKDKIERAKRI